jgi:organic radical activating enzyme
MNNIENKLRKRGEFFCPAKWEELYLYLNHGNTNSCHHPIPHAIPIEEVINNPAALHNTSHKLSVQQQMLDNETPAECHMCWHLEQKNITSDRFIKSETWEDSIATLEVNPDHVPKFIEIVFDNLCNLNCSYCDSGQSSKWAGILEKTGAWNLNSDTRDLYNKVHIKPNSIKQEYLDAWNIWWPQIKSKVQTLKISGGEPLISPNFWRTMDQLEPNDNNLSIALNSNLSVDTKYIEKLIEYSPKIKKIRIAASIDSVGKIAEFTRGGLDYNLFCKNIHYWCANSPDNCFLNLQSTVNVFNIWNITDKFDLHLELKQQYGDKVTDFYSTLVRFPEFQSILVLPYTLRSMLYEKISIWYDANIQKFTNKEKIYIDKTFQYLISEDDSVNQNNKLIYKNDLKNFIKKYEGFTKYKFKDVYPIEFVNWLEQP